VVVVGDLNGDGKADIAVAGPSEVSVLMNQGHGTFAVPVTYVADIPPGPAVALAIADLNGDGVPDVVLGDSGLPATEASPGAPGGVSVFMNSGSGALVASPFYPVGGPVSFALGDVDGAPGTDLVVGNPGGTPYLLANNGDGTLAAVRLITGAPPDASSWSGTGAYVALGDFNGDGFADLAVAGNGDVVSILPGSRDGTFTSTFSYAATGGNGSSFSGVALGDVNGDGKLDLAVAMSQVEGSDNSFMAGPVSLLMNNGDGTLASPVAYAGTDITYPVAVALGDLNGDGELDLVVGDETYMGDSVGVRLNDGTGRFMETQSLWTGSLGAFALGDLDGDGMTDLVVVGQDGLSVLLNDSH
jgi:FG-GAP-like repeat